MPTTTQIEVVGLNSRGTGTITNTTIISNVAEVDGGGMRIDDLTAKVRIVDSQIAYNHASIGGGIHVGQAELVVQGTQIVSNTAGETGGAIYAESFPNTVVTDSCIVHNSDAAVTAYVDESAILAPNNWWGMDDGPGGTGPGFGDTVEGSVVYSDFKTTPPAGCPRLVPDLHISKVVRPDFALPGQVIAYTIVLSNAGTGADRNVSITDSLPAQIRFFLWREEPPPGTTVTDNSIAWSGSLAAQQNATFVFEIGNTGSYARSVTNTVSFIGSEQTGSASAGLALTTDPYFRHDARPKVAPSQFQYRTGEQVRVVISGVWPHRCVPEPTLQEYIHNPDPSVELPIHVYYSIDDGFRMELWMKELVKLRKEYEKAIAQGKGDEFYAKTCGDTETSWSYTFVGNDIPSALYDVVIVMDWEEWNPLNQYPQWYCYSPNHYYCYRSTHPNVFVVGELVNLPAIRK
ncbi:MAG: DUF11 domain-containing protein [Anaerolineales bacterium]|nr:DUF11 domain-containing protein [Anaerolineales bacterium]